MVFVKRLLLILVLSLNLQCLTKADDISDFEIEGMSIGDSLLDFFSIAEIEENYSGSQYPNKEFVLYYFTRMPNFKTYEGVTIAVKANDKSYFIYDIGGSIYFPNNFNKCLDKMKNIEKDLRQIFNNVEVYSGENQHPYDKSGKTRQVYTTYHFDSGDNSQIVCLNWSKELEKEGHIDELNLTIGLKEYGDFVSTRAFN